MKKDYYLRMKFYNMTNGDTLMCSADEGFDMETDFAHTLRVLPIVESNLRSARGPSGEKIITTHYYLVGDFFDAIKTLYLATATPPRPAATSIFCGLFSTEISTTIQFLLNGCANPRKKEHVRKSFASELIPEDTEEAEEEWEEVDSTPPLECTICFEKIKEKYYYACTLGMKSVGSDGHLVCISCAREIGKRSDGERVLVKESTVSA